ncbi:hypothetical protein OS31_24250 [Dickeya oryzae]
MPGLHHNAVFTFGIGFDRAGIQTSGMLTVIARQRIKSPLFVRVDGFPQRVDIAPEQVRL